MDKAKVKKAWNVISAVIVAFILIAAICALGVAVGYRVQGQTLTVGGTQIRLVLTGSMEGEAEDSIRTHSVIAIKTVPEDKEQADEFIRSLKEGDIITFRSSAPGETGMVITHRIIDVREDGGEITFITKGDANDSADASPVKAENVIGAVTGSDYPLGAILTFLTSSTGIVVCLIVPAALIMIYEIFRIAFLVSKDKKQKSQSEAEDREREIERLRRELDELKRREENND